MSMNLADEPLLSGSLSESQALPDATVSVDPEQAANVTETTVDTGPTVMTNNLKHMPNNRVPSSKAICKIRPYLFLTGFRSISADKIKELGITHAVDATNINVLQVAGVEYIKVKIDDDELANIQQHFEPVSKFIEKAKCSGGKIMVYCVGGMSRSATLCIMHLVISEGITLRNSFIEVSKARPIICPNHAFWRQMIDYETNKNGACSVTLVKRGQLLIPDVCQTLDFHQPNVVQRWQFCVKHGTPT